MKEEIQESDLRRRLAETKRQLDREKRRAAHLQSLLDKVHDNLDRQLQAKYKFGKNRVKPPRGSFVRVAIADTHGCLITESAFQAVLDDMAALKPREVVLLGDHVDCGGFLAEHFVLGYVAQTKYTYEEDIAAANCMLDRVQAACPDARLYYIEGNHEMRVEKWCVTKALRNTQDAAFLFRHFAPRHLLGLEKRGISYYSQADSHDGLRARGTLKLGPVYFTHGISHAKNAAQVHIQHFHGSVVFGHVHRAQSIVTHSVKSGDIGAWCPGCLCDPQPLWQHSKPTEWTHGYHVQVVAGDSMEFLAIQVPILEGGRSYLQALL